MQYYLSNHPNLFIELFRLFKRYLPSLEDSRYFFLSRTYSLLFLATFHQRSNFCSKSTRFSASNKVAFSFSSNAMKSVLVQVMSSCNYSDDFTVAEELTCDLSMQHLLYLMTKHTLHQHRF
jgi:hypothetical protein